MKRSSRPFTVEVIRSRRKEPIPIVPNLAEPIISAPSEAEADKAEPVRQGRILLALEPAAADVAPVRAGRRVKRRQPHIYAAAAEAEDAGGIESNPAILPSIGLAKIVKGERRSKVRDQLTREAFRRSERWRHRLPSVIQRPKRRPNEG